MASDRDRYGRALGKRFWAVRGTLCGPGSDETKTDALATYMMKTLRKALPDLREHSVEIDAALNGLPNLFMIQDTTARLKRHIPDSLAGEHLVEAARHALMRNGHAESVLAELALQAVAATKTRMVLQDDFREDRECHEAFTRHMAAAASKLGQLLREHCRLESGARTPERSSVPTQSEILDFVLVQQ